MSDEDFTSHQPYQGQPGGSHIRGRQQQELRRIVGRIRDIFQADGEDFQDGDEKRLVVQPPEEPPFPYVILMIAIVKDLSDVPGELSVIGVIITTITSLFTGLILFLWTYNRLSGGWWMKGDIRWMWRKVFTAGVIELIPFLKIVPSSTIFVLMAIHKEKKIVQLFTLALEELRNAGVIKYMK